MVKCIICEKEEEELKAGKCKDCYDMIVDWNKDNKINDEEYESINPSHYTDGIECIDYIQPHKMSFTEGNIVKYITRYKQKNGMQDLLKAKRYLEFLIEDYGKEV